MPPKMGCGSLWGETQAYIDRMTRALRVAVGLVFPVVGAALGCGDGSAPGPTPRPLLQGAEPSPQPRAAPTDRKSTRLNSSHITISYAVFCLKKKKIQRDC